MKFNPIKTLLFSTALVFVFIGFSFAGLPEFSPDEFVSPNSSTKFEPTKKLEVDQFYGDPFPQMPGHLVERRMSLSLTDLIDAALEVNPSTKQAWFNAKASAAEWGKAKSTYYPNISNTTDAIGGRTPDWYNNKSYVNNSLGLNYLLFDFGKRKGDSDAAKNALIKSDMMYNQKVLDVLRDVPRAYYLLIGMRALVVADQKSLAEARVNLNVAEERKRAGIATLADVLQAKSNEAEAVLVLEGDKGNVEIAKGRLATAVGWPANIEFDIADELMAIPIGKMSRNADELINTALENRPDLSAAVAEVKQKEAELKSAKSLHYPKLYGKANFDYFRNRDYGSKAYYGGVNLQIPIFQGFSIVNQVRAAKAKLSAASEGLQISKETVVSDVWNANYDLLTSLKQVEAAKALLASAEQSFEVSLGRYKEGVADIVELMTVWTELASARSQLINSKTNVHINFAELVHAIGTGFGNPTEIANSQ